MYEILVNLIFERFITIPYPFWNEYERRGGGCSEPPTLKIVINRWGFGVCFEKQYCRPFWVKKGECYGTPWEEDNGASSR